MCRCLTSAHGVSGQRGRLPRRAVGLLLAALAAATVVGNTGWAAQKKPNTKKSAKVAEAAPKLDASEIYQRLLHSTAFITADNAEQPMWTGSGWVIDTRRKLLLTNEHVVDNLEEVYAIFPEYEGEEPIADRTHYLTKSKRIRGKVFLADAARDLAVVELDSLPEGIRALSLAPRSPRAGETLHSVGNPIDEMWIYTQGTVRGVFTTTWLTGDPIAGVVRRSAKVVENQSPTNHGDSGGPVVNDQGLVVAVVEGGSNQGNLLQRFIDVSEVKSFMQEVNELWHPQTAEEFYKRGERLLATERYDRALKDLSQAIRLDRKLAEAYVARGEVFRHRGDYESALGDLNQAIELNADSLRAFEARGKTYLEQGRYDQALADFTSAVRLDPTRPAGYNLRGVVYLKQSALQQALDEFNEALRLDAKFAECLNNRGDVFWAKGDYDAALQDYLAAFEADKTYALAATNVGYVLALKKGDPVEGMRWFDEAVAIRPRDPEMRFYRGDCRVALQQYGDAVVDFTTAIALNERYPNPYYRRGDAYLAMGEYNAALGDYLKAIELRPNVGVLYYKLGLTLRALNNQADAQAAFQKAVELEPSLADLLASEGSGNTDTPSGSPAADSGSGTPSTDTPSAEMSTFYTRHIVADNRASQRIYVFMLYYTFNDAGEWNWYGDASEQTYWIVQPGATSFLAMDNVPVHAYKIRIWARSEDGSLVWDTYQNQDLEIAPATGYQAKEREAFTYTFNVGE